MRLYYIVRSEMLDGGVIEAQVIARLRTQTTLLDEPTTKLVFLEPARVAFGRKVRATLKAYRAMWPQGHISVVPFVSRLGEAGVGRALALFLWRERLTTSPLVFHCRGAAATCSADVARRLLGRGRVVFDLRGASPYEVAHRFGSPEPVNLSEPAERAYLAALQQEQTAARAADFVLAVSEELKTYATEVLGASADRVLVTPSCVDRLTFDQKSRAEVRRRWGVAEAVPVFLYAGRIGPERLPARMFQMFAAVLRQQPEAKLVLLTYRDDLESVDAMLTAAAVPLTSVIQTSCPRDRVVEQLCGADVGMFFCEHALRFRYCFPIKFPEYLSAGLSVLVNNAAAGVPDLVRANGLGWVLDDELEGTHLDTFVRTMLAGLNAQRDDIRQRALSCCSERYLLKNHKASLQRAYELAEVGRVSAGARIQADLSTGQ